MQAQWTRNLGKIGGPEAGRRAVARYSNAANKARARGEKPREAEAYRHWWARRQRPPAVPAAEAGEGASPGARAQEEGASRGAEPGPCASGPPAAAAGGERGAGSGEKGFANRQGSAACDGVSFGRRFWARRVGFSARSDLRPLFFAPLHSFQKLDFIL
jgi:hypothetical protein